MNKPGKPTKIKYNRDDMRVATFRITHGQWEDFQTKCAEQDKSASEAITAFIDSVIDGDSIPESKGEFPDVEAMVKVQLETAITQLRDELKPEPVNIDKLKDAVLNALTEPEKKQ